METKYRVQSLERALSILGVLQKADGPVRNQDVVQCTGLPKATVSRLLHTLTNLGYARRNDLGAYVLAGASARGGRALVGALQLHRHDDLFSQTQAIVFLEAVWARSSIAIHAWSPTGARMVTNGAALKNAPSARFEDRTGGDIWEPDTSTWWAWAHADVPGVGGFVFTHQHVRQAPPDAKEGAQIHGLLRQASRALSCSAQH